MICRAIRSPSGNDSFSATGALFDRRRNRFYRVGRQPNRRWHSPVTGAPDARYILRRRAVSSGDRGRTAYETRRNRRSFIVSAPAIFGSFASLQRNSPHGRKKMFRRSAGTTPQSPAATAPLTGEPFPPPLQGEVAFAQQMSEGLRLVDKSQFISILQGGR